MKKFKALTASIIASAMAMSMVAGFAALAVTGEVTPPVSDGDSGNQQAAPAGTSYTISVTNKDTDNAQHTYEAYQIFTGTMENDGETEVLQLNVTDWGTGVDGSALVKALKNDTKIGGYFKDLGDDATAKDVADILTKNDKDFVSDNDNMQAFAKVAAANITDTKKGSAAAKEVGGKYVTEIEVEEAGYYLIKDIKGSPKGTMEVNGKDEEFTTAGQTRYILTPTTALTPKSKADYPTIDKNISVEKDGETELVDFNTAAIGDTITYVLDSKVPDMDGYNKYFYIVNDTLSSGLTLNYDATNLKGIQVKIGDFTLTNQNPNDEDVNDTEDDHEFYVETTTAGDGSTKIKVVFKNFIQYNKGDKITITYDAILNKDAIVGTKGNPNYVDLTFSNNPNFTYEGTPDPEDPNKPNKPDEPNPDGTEPTGETPKVKVITYTTEINLKKVDAKTGDTLTGAEFKIEGSGVNSTLKAETTYDEDENGTYYKLANGTYTKTAPDGTNDDLYASTTQKYTKNVDVTSKVDAGFKTKLDLAIDDDGMLKMTGLNPGTYTITETKAAKGGYLLKDTPAVITITADPSLESCDWTYECSNVEDVKENADGTLTFSFTNVKGVQLPGTGAFGTKLIYALGTIFTGVGAAYAISKKKSKKDEE